MSESINAQELLAQLGISTAEEDVAIMPSAGESFGAGSIIAQWSARIMYQFLTDVDYVLFNDESDVKVAPPDIRREMGDSGWFNMYYNSYDDALSTYHTLDPDAKPTSKSRGYKPKVYWVFTAPTASVLNSRDLEKMVQGFGDQLLFSSRVMALSRGKGGFALKERHEFGLLGLPGAVAAAADVFGFANAGFDLSEFTEPDAKDNMDDEFFVKFCGHVEGGYKESELYKRRVALWASLGEDNPDASAIIGAKTAKGKPNKNATTSKKLSACLSIAQGKWTVPMWARIVLVPNPMVADNGEHYRLPVLGEIFKSEAEAREAARVELAGGEDDGLPSGQAEASHPPLGGWTGGTPGDVVAHLVADVVDKEGVSIGSIISRMSAATMPPSRAALAAEAYLDNWADLVAWAKYAEDNG